MYGSLPCLNTAWQELDKPGGGLVGASISIREENRDTFSDATGGTLTLIRANGEPLVTARVERKGTMYACNPRAMFFARTNTFEMVPTSVSAELDSNERIHGTLILETESKKFSFALPETQVNFHE